MYHEKGAKAMSKQKKSEKEKADKQIEELQRKIDELEMAKREQQDWIVRLLEYMDLSEQLQMQLN